MKKCQMLGLVLVGLLSKTALGAAVPPGYPIDSVGYAPSQNSRVVYLCRENIWNIKFQTPEKITASACFEKMEIAIAAVNTDTDWYANCVKHESVTKPSMICDRFKKYYNYSGKNDVRTILVGTAMIGDLVNKQNISNPFCPPSEALIMFSEGHDTNGDGKIDLCFNPADKLKEREPVDDPCKERYFSQDPNPPVTTPSTADEALIRAAAEEAIALLEQINADLSSPDAGNKEKLDALASIVGLTNSSGSDFNPVKNTISGLSSCLLTKLDAVKQSPRDAGYRIKSDRNAESRGMEAQTCIVKNGDRRVELTEKALKNYENEHIFRHQPLLLLPATLIHENQHICGKKHEVDQNDPDFEQLSKARFSNRIAEYNSLKEQRSEQQNAFYLKTLFSDPTFLEYLLEVYL